MEERMAVVITSTTDSQEDVNLAAGLTKDGKDPEAAEQQTATATPTTETPAATTEAGKEAAAGDDKNTAQPAAAGADGEDQEEKKKKKGGFQKKIDRLERELRDERDARMRLEGRTEAGGERPSTRTAAANIEADPEPKATDAKYKGDSAYEDYLRDVGRWEARQEFAKLNKQAREQQNQEGESQRLKVTYDEHLGRVRELRGQVEDFDEVTSGKDVEIPQSAVLPIIESPVSAHLVYFLYQNPEVVAELKEMSPLRQSVYIGKLEAKIEAEITPDDKDKNKSKNNAGGAAGANGAAAGAAGTGKEVKKVVSGAPAPITPVTGAPTRSPKALSELSGDEYRKARRAGRTQ